MRDLTSKDFRVGKELLPGVSWISPLRYGDAKGVSCRDGLRNGGRVNGVGIVSSGVASEFVLAYASHRRPAMSCNSEERMNTWEKVYPDRFRLSRVCDSIYWNRPLYDAVTDLAEPGSRLLEVGIGSGAGLLYLADRGYRCVGVDVSRELIRRAKEASNALGLEDNVELLQADMFSLGFKADTFRLVYHQGVLEHFSDQEICLALAEQLRVAPTVVFSVPLLRYGRQDFGDERLLTIGKWNALISTVARVQRVVGYDHSRAHGRGQALIGTLAFPLIWHRHLYHAARDRLSARQCIFECERTA